MDKPIPEAVRDALSWLRAALDCPTFSWDADQRDAAESALTAAQQQDHIVDANKMVAAQQQGQAQGGGEPLAWMVEWTDEDDGKPIRIAFEYLRGAENRRDEVGGAARVFPLYAEPPSAPVGLLREVIEGLVSEIECETCQHEETYRGGALWEICHQCGAKWADDRGGRPEFKWSPVVEHARDILAQQPTAVDEAMVERACKRYAFREDGAVWPDAYSEYEVLAERRLMREFLEHVLATQHQEPTSCKHDFRRDEDHGGACCQLCGEVRQ